MKEYNNFIDSFVNIFRKFKIFSPLIKIYDNCKEGILYLFFGFLSTFVNIFIYHLLANVININYMISNIIAWCITVMFAYLTNKVYVFESKTKNKKELLKEVSSFFSARIFSLILEIVVMYVGISIFHFNDLVIKVLSNIFVIILNYFMSKLFIFNNN